MAARFYGVRSSSRIEVRVYKLQRVWGNRRSESEKSQSNAVAVERHVLIEVIVLVGSLFDSGLPVVVGDEIQDLMIEAVVLPRKDPVHGIVVSDVAGVESPGPLMAHLGPDEPAGGHGALDADCNIVLGEVRRRGRSGRIARAHVEARDSISAVRRNGQHLGRDV